MDDTIKLSVINMTKLYPNGDGVKNIDLDVHTVAQAGRYSLPGEVFRAADIDPGRVVLEFHGALRNGQDLFQPLQHDLGIGAVSRTDHHVRGDLHGRLDLELVGPVAGSGLR